MGDELNVHLYLPVEKLSLNGTSAEGALNATTANSTSDAQPEMVIDAPSGTALLALVGNHFKYWMPGVLALACSMLASLGLRHVFTFSRDGLRLRAPLLR